MCLRRMIFLMQAFPITVKEILDSYRKLLKIKDKQEVDRVLELPI